MTYPNTLYPHSKDSNDFFEVIDGDTPIDSSFLQDKLGNTILVLEKELGIKPSGTYSDVRQRLDAMEAGLSLLGGANTPHSTTIAAKYRHNILNPLVTYPNSTTKTIQSVVGKVALNPQIEAGFKDGYGVVCINCRFYVDSDIDNFELSLWDVTQNPIQITTNTFAAGEHTYYILLNIPIVNIDKVYEIRVSQTSSIFEASHINSIVWNSRFLFIPTQTGGGGGGGGGSTSIIEYVLTTFSPSDVFVGKKIIGTIPLLGMVQSTVIIIDSPFNGNTAISVGDASDNSSLMSSSANIPSVADKYSNDSDKEYIANTDVSLYFSGNPTMGHGTAISYFHSGQNVLKYISASFSFNDIASLSKLIGSIPKASEIQSVMVLINSPFDGNTTISVGDDSNNAILMDTISNIPTIANKYRNDSDVLYSADTNIKLYFTGTPTTGQGSVIVYFH
jgi:hypothetical protein